MYGIGSEVKHSGQFFRVSPEGGQTAALDLSGGVRTGVPAEPTPGERSGLGATIGACELAVDRHQGDLGCTDRGSELGVRSSRGDGGRRNCKRNTPHDTTTPLQKWLLENQGNPYPTKTEKAALASASDMTLVQVTNWFANARRRLKGTARKPGLTWSKRLQLYSRRAAAEDGDVQGRLPGELDGPSKDDSDHQSPLNLRAGTPFVIAGWDSNRSCLNAPSTAPNGEEARQLSGPPRLPPSPAYPTETANSHKFKQTILHRYLNDSVGHRRHGYQPPSRRYDSDRTPPSAMCCKSGSAGAYDNEDASSSCSPNSIGSDGNQTAFQDGCALYVDYSQSSGERGRGRRDSRMADISQKDTDAEEIYWKEIIAAVVLTNMARARLQQQRPV